MSTQKLFFSLFLGLLVSSVGKAQAVDSIFFNLYTDSLKKGVHNYINIDARLTNGKWRPMTSKEIIFSASAGKFEGNSLIIDTSFKDEKVTVKAVLKENPSVVKELIIYIKKVESTEPLKTLDEIMNRPTNRRTRKNRKG